MNRQMTLGNFLDYWLHDAVKDNVRQSTYTAYRGYIENHIKRHIGTEPLMRLKTECLQGLVSDLKNGNIAADKFETITPLAKPVGKRGGGFGGTKCAVFNKGGRPAGAVVSLVRSFDGMSFDPVCDFFSCPPLATKTVRSIFFMLRGALEFAAECGYIAKNPCAGVRLPRLEEKEVKAFSQKEQNKLQMAIERIGDIRNFGVLISLYTGLRIGEVCALKWTSINFSGRELLVKASLNREILYNNQEKRTAMVETEPKTKKSRRTIPLPKFLCHILKQLKTLSKSDYVISMKSGKAVEPRTLQIIYKKLLRSAKIEATGFHTLRHTFATRAIELGTDVKTISEILGHINTMITVNRYTHSLVEQKRKMMKGFDVFYQQSTPVYFLD